MVEPRASRHLLAGWDRLGEIYVVLYHGRWSPPVLPLDLQAVGMRDDVRVVPWLYLCALYRPACEFIGNQQTLILREIAASRSLFT